MMYQTRTLLALLVGGVLLSSCATGTISDAAVVRQVEKTVAERQPAPEDKRFDEIAWSSDIRAAIKLGQEYHRPIFLITGDGRINTGRC
jgi:hypothetical protein